jgi:hypothetical protein
MDEKLNEHFDKIDNCIRKASIAIHEIYDEWNKFRAEYDELMKLNALNCTAENIKGEE